MSVRRVAEKTEAQSGLSPAGFARGEKVRHEKFGVGKIIHIDGAKMPHLFPGSSMKLTPMGTPGGVGSDFQAALLRHTAAALGVSPADLSRDFARVNYSGLKGELIAPRDAHGKLLILQENYSQIPVNGASLQLSLDASIQHIVTGKADEFVVPRTAHDHIIPAIEAMQFIIAIPAQQVAGFDRFRIPHRAIGKNDFLDCVTVVAAEVMLDSQRFAGIAEGDFQVITGPTAGFPLQLHVIRRNSRLEFDTVSLPLNP